MSTYLHWGVEGVTPLHILAHTGLFAHSGWGVYGHNLTQACAPFCIVTNIAQMAFILPRTVYFTHFF